MKSQFVAAALFALATGCVATATPGYVGVQAVTPTVSVDVTPPAVDVDVNAGVVADAEPAPIDDADYDDDVYEGEPDLVEYEGNANIRVVYGSADPTFWSDGYYWRYGSDGVWMRSSVHTGGWAVYGDIPVHIRTIDRPVRFRSYKPAHYTPKPRKVGVRPANRHPSYQRNYHKAHPQARPHKVNNRPDARHTTPAHKTNNRPDARHTTPAHKTTPTHTNNRPDARPTQTKTVTKTTTKTETKTVTPAPKKDPPKKYDEKKKDKRK